MAMARTPRTRDLSGSTGGDGSADSGAAAVSDGNHHEWHRDRAELARATCKDLSDEAIVMGLFTIADRLADLTEVLAARAPSSDGPTTAPKAAEAVLEEQYRGGSE
jgi:hypothetical protein